MPSVAYHRMLELDPSQNFNKPDLGIETESKGGVIHDQIRVRTLISPI